MKVAEEEVMQLLQSIPLAKNTFSYEKLCASITLMEKKLSKLKAFLSFLISLTPLSYRKWLERAYARYVPSTSLEPPTLPTPLQSVTYPERKVASQNSSKRLVTS